MKKNETPINYTIFNNFIRERRFSIILSRLSQSTLDCFLIKKCFEDALKIIVIVLLCYY